MAADLPIPFFAAAREYAELKAEIDAALSTVMASGQALQGPAVAAFEAAVAARAGRKHAVAVGSATDAIYFALLSAGLGPGDEALAPAISFVASASPILRAGAIPVFCDVLPNGAMDLADAARKTTDKTRAVVHVDLFGGMSDPGPVEAFAEERGLALIEDAAQAFGASYRGRPAGSLGFASAFSFDPTKVLSAPGSGGMALVDDDAVAARLRGLRLHGRSDQGFAELGYNSQMSSLTAATLGVKLGRHDAWTDRREAVAAAYDAAFADLPLELDPPAAGVRHARHKYVVRSDMRDALADSLAHLGVPTRIHYSRPIYREPAFAHLRPAACPEAERFAARALSLPIHAQLTTGEIERVVAAVCGFFT